MATKLNISVGEATKLFDEHQKLLVNNQGYESDYIALGLPELGSLEWANIVEANSICPPGSLKLVGFSASELANFRVIPENGSNLEIPNNDTVYPCDGFYYKLQPCDPLRYWYKISNSGSVVITKNPNGPWNSVTDWSVICKAAAIAQGKPFVVGWQSDQQKHTTSNPFCP